MKFKSMLHAAPRDEHGGHGSQGQAILVPVDDFAKVHPRADAAAELINPNTGKPYYERTDPQEKVKLQAAIRAKMYKAAGVRVKPKEEY